MDETLQPAQSHNCDVTLGVLNELPSPRESINSMIFGN